MPTINVLDKEVSELIAAGEVIERPSSVIKELVENSVDSGAKHITVEIKNGGTTYMRVTDDGCGISFEDVPKAFLRHATSKISDKADLDNILTLGFRGEALASVAAVSSVEVMTKPKGETYGTLYNIEGSVEVSHEKGGCPDGTTIIIRDLFYNVPARRKFMKKDVTEGNAVSQILQKITMSHPDIAFKFIRDNRVEFNSSGDGELYSAIYAIYGRDFTRSLVETDYEYNGVHVSGYVVKPLYSRTNRSFQNFFVNGRYVRSRICTSALENAYTNMIMVGKFPACVMMIDLSPSAMDVNIHPAKAEVRFTDEKNVSDAIYFAVKNALSEDGMVYEFRMKPRVDWTKKLEEPQEVKQQEFIFTPVDKIAEAEKSIEQPRNAEISAPEPETADIEPFSAYNKPAEGEKTEKAESIEAPQHSVMETELTENVSAAEEEPEPEEKEEELSEIKPVEGFSYINTASFKKAPEPVILPDEKASQWTEKPKIRVIGEAFGVYIVAETDDKKFILIDKHAAHERIIFEELKSRNCRQYSQMLINGVKVLLAGDDFSALEENTEMLADMGFSFDFSQKPCAVATAVPTFIMELDMEEIIAEIAVNLRMNKHDPQSHSLDDLLHTVACKSAIRGNDKSSLAELQALADRVYNDDTIRHCPHGRPVMFTMTKSNIDHQFGRT
ncbi:MAG: DNA mismatch repair endonuclease MutL [Ruminococcus sp.]|nr:DNA mismatch repair endonuclease MutL [Ruminococcus sp.]